MSSEKIIKEIKYELSEIENLLDLYKKELFELKGQPNLVELTALASVFHSFYTGAEKIFICIAKIVDKNIPHDINWHKTLLFQMTRENEYRKAILSDTTTDELLGYLSFRHFYRHSYSFRLKWSEMEHLVVSIQQTWEKFKSEILSFVKTLEDNSLLSNGFE